MPEFIVPADIDRSFAPVDGKNLIDGQLMNGSGDWFESTSSIDGSTVTRARKSTADDVDGAVRAAQRALTGVWASSTGAQRARVLNAWATALEQKVDEFATLLAHEVGMVARLARDSEVMGSADKLRYYAGLARDLKGEVTGGLDPEVLDLTRPVPIGVAALITPWNNPLEQPVRQIGAALAAGCTIVVKTSESTPASTEALIRLALDIPELPAGVVNLVHGPGSITGEALTSHSGVDKISFTGSTATALRIGGVAGRGMKHISLEAGGKTPCVVYADADVDKAINALVYGSFVYSGQSCSAATRILVESSIYEEFTSRFEERARRLIVGDPRDGRSEVGPMITEAHADGVRAAINAARSAGIHLVETHPGLTGTYVSPTIAVAPPLDSDVATQEIFGPVVVVMPFKTEDDAVTISNSLPYGLQASVWSSNIDKALRTARQIEAGDVWVNTHYIRNAETPYGGWKLSGLGRELGRAGLQEYLKHQRIAIDTRAHDHLSASFA